MRFQTILAASASLLSLASARIIGIAVPDTIQPGGGFNAIIETEDYIQSVYDVAIVFGVAPGAGYPGNLGNVMDSFYLGPGKVPSSQNLKMGILTKHCRAIQRGL
jgi:Nis1 family